MADELAANVNRSHLLLAVARPGLRVIERSLAEHQRSKHMRRGWKRKLSIAVAGSFIAATAWAQNVVVDTAYVERALAHNAVVWDARDAADYAGGHIPGAINFGWVGDVFRDPNREDLPTVAQAEKIFGAAGVDPVRKEVIVYTRKGDPYAYYGLHAMQYYGAKHAKVYHGGIDDWKAAGKRVTKDATTLAPLVVDLAAQEGLVLWNKDMLERVRAGGSQILDVRTPAEYTGEDIRAVRGGHVPGAVNIPHEQNWRDPQSAVKLAHREVQTRDGMALKDEAALRALYARLDPAKETIVYCESGVRASQTATILRTLGFRDVKIYEPSWLGYAGMLNAPAEDEVFVNVEALTKKIAALESEVKGLEEELARLKSQQQ
jgi:thiosulfate/3-mercaptopyruvate sulfurtransferase